GDAALAVAVRPETDGRPVRSRALSIKRFPIPPSGGRPGIESRSDHREGQAPSIRLRQALGPSSVDKEEAWCGSRSGRKRVALRCPAVAEVASTPRCPRRAT